MVDGLRRGKPTNITTTRNPHTGNPSRNRPSATSRMGEVMTEKQERNSGANRAESVTDLSIPQYLTAADLASKFQLHVSTIRHEIQEGKLEAVKFGSGYRIDPAHVPNWLEARKVVSMNDRKPVTLRRGSGKETQFGAMAREMDRAGREAPAETVRHAEAS